MLNSSELIEHFELTPHPEGGWYRESYKSDELIALDALPARFRGDRLFSTAIYFLLEEGNFSTFHRIKSDECWHFYAGGPLLIYTILPDDSLTIIELGNEPTKGQYFQHVVPAGCWFASRPSPGTAFSFVGCTVAPGFDFADFEIARRQQLLERYPQHGPLILELCRD